jgi:hypothetical protein
MPPEPYYFATGTLFIFATGTSFYFFWSHPPYIMPPEPILFATGPVESSSSVLTNSLFRTLASLLHLQLVNRKCRFFQCIDPMNCTNRISSYIGLFAAPSVRQLLVQILPIYRFDTERQYQAIRYQLILLPLYVTLQ